jgi:anti-repressor protein
MELTNFNSEQIYSSLFLVEKINVFRKEEGNETVLLHKSFLSKIEKEFDEEIAGQNILPSSYLAGNGKQEKCYELTFEQSLQILMSESKTVRKRVIDVLKERQEKQAPKPLNMFEMISFMALSQSEAIKKQEQLELKQVEIEKKVLEIESKQTTIDTNFYTISGYANLHKLKVDTQEANRLGRIASKTSRELQYPTGKAFDSKYGEIKTYHVDILKMTFKN